jgi:hypothetical protein
MKTKIKHGMNLKPEERFLFERLHDVMRLEGAMAAIRQEYYQFWDNIFRRVQEKHSHLDWPYNRSCDSKAQFVIGKRCWPSASPPWPSGFYVASISFEHLCSPEEEAPSAGIWIQPPKKLRIDLESIRKPFTQKAERLLGMKLWDEGKSYISLYYDLPESREALLGMLAKKNDVKFADCMVAHFEKLAKLIPLIDEVFKVKKGR